MAFKLLPLRRAPARDEAAIRAFVTAVARVVNRIPRGKLLTYGDVARMAGYPGRPRQVGMALKGMPEDITIPWQRVVNAKGLVPQRSRFWGAWEQMRRLRAEGIPVDDDGNLPLARFRWQPRRTTAPVRRVAAKQRKRRTPS
jgi:methylated-DNA-protein-cysteine methyltransferase-like protein